MSMDSEKIITDIVKLLFPQSTIRKFSTYMDGEPYGIIGYSVQVPLSFALNYDKTREVYINSNNTLKQGKKIKS